jgi:hypothetical protein
MSAPTDRAALEKAIDQVDLAIAHLQAFRWDDAVRTIRATDWPAVRAAAQAHFRTLPKNRLTWIVTETSFGKTTGWRHFEDLSEALTTAGKWVSQSVGDVTIGRREVEA